LIPTFIEDTRTQKNLLHDRKENEVKEGSKIRVVMIEPRVIASLAGDELSDVTSMLNEVFQVYEIDENNLAWVEKWWDCGERKSKSHSLALSSAEIELAE
jgi:hypothetical protein